MTLARLPKHTLLQWPPLQSYGIEGGCMGGRWEGMECDLPAKEIRQSHRKTSCEQCSTLGHVVTWTCLEFVIPLTLVWNPGIHYNRHYNPINSHGFAKYNAKVYVEKDGLKKNCPSPWLRLNYLTRFFDRIRGDLTAAPNKLDPVRNILWGEGGGE